MKKKSLFFITALVAISVIAAFVFLQKSNQNSDSRNIVQNTDKSEQTYNPSKPDNNAPKSESGSTVVTISSQTDLNALAQANNIKPESIKKIEGSSSYELAVSKSNLIVPQGIAERVKTQENIIYKAMVTPNDPLFQYQWHLNKISAPPAWDISKSSSSIKVAVIDSGFALDHQDLTNKFDKANAYDFINNDSIPMAGDTGAFVYHGTMVAGLVGASTNNGIGVSSVAWDANILPIQALNDAGEGNTFTIASAINYAVSKGAKVINLSLGSFSADPVMEGAINNAISSGVSVVAASGNSGCDCLIYPANYPNVIAVGATDINDNRASFSNYGNNLDIVAPGTGTIRTTFMSASNKTSLYTTSANGTSIATPIVSGAIALILDKKPDLRPTQVDAFLKNGADKVIGMNGQNFTKEYGHGRLNISKTFDNLLNPNISWNFESLDGSVSSVSGQDGAFGQTPRAIQFGTSIQVFYYDVTNGNLKRSYENGSGWVTETLDGAGGINGRINADVGKMPATAIYNNQLHVFYFDVSNGDLRHGVSDINGGNWTFETLDGDSQTGGRTTAKVGVNPAVAVYGNTLQVFHYDDTAGNLRHTWFTPGTGWSNENLDGDPGSVGRANANLGEDPEVVIYNNEIQLYYYDITYGNLRHAWTTPKGWAFENLDGDPGSVGRSNSNLGRNPSLAVHNGQLQLYYYDIQYGNLRHAWTTNRGWAFENLDGDPGAIFGRNKNTGVTPKVISYNNVLYLFYYDQTDGELRYAYADNTGWHNYSLDGKPESISSYATANTGIDPTIISKSGELQLFYYNVTSNDLTHAWLKI